jgi:Protein of unknown function (DUF2589)
MAEEITIGSEFQSLPLEFIVSAPLTAAVQAQATAAATTLAFLNTTKDNYLAFTVKTDENGNAVNKVINVPVLACVPVPHLRIDSVTTNFKFEITQQVKDTDSTTEGAELSGGLSGIPWLNLSLKGNITHESSREATSNKSGMLDITVHASESDMPAGLQKVLDWLTSSVPSAKTAQASGSDSEAGPTKAASGKSQP